MERRTKNIEQKYLELIAGQPKSVGGRLLRFCLRVASWGYRGVVTVRNLLFDAGLKRSHYVTEPVISVGNLTTGGTGKTPTVALLVDLLKERGHYPGIISRGYRELPDGGNDEARVLQLLCPGTPHAQGRDRVAAALDVSWGEGCTVILADDAFQHRRLKRDLDIVLIDAINPWGHGALLPLGLLREPVSGLRRADVVILTRADLIDEVSREEIWRIVKENNQTIATVELSFEPTGLVDKAGTQLTIEAANAASRSTVDSGSEFGVVAFCGIGNPEGFRRTLEAAGIAIRELVAFPDHHHYEATDLQRLTVDAQKIAASAMITTVKDLVKIQPEWLGAVPLFALNIQAEVTSGRESLSDALSAATQQRTR
ncbi:MAG: tetraacyldisaccharide 4'-kinase [Planctomycetota bacterium]|nr:tetraacyldisaccharide 4'-kinase [Planctomycetota bacterium]MDA1161889.1 tetraacyldisaccharide 4'-kinase [Planctomycetota bacterium]